MNSAFTCAQRSVSYRGVSLMRMKSETRSHGFRVRSVSAFDEMLCGSTSHRLADNPCKHSAGDGALLIVLFTARSLESPSAAEMKLRCRDHVEKPRGSFSRCLCATVLPLSTSPTTGRPTIHAHCHRLVVQLERGVAETGTQAADAPTAETLRDVREAIPRVVPHGRRRTCGCGMVLRARSGSSADRHERFPPGSMVPSQPFLDVWEKNVPISGRSALPPQPGHL